MKISFVKYQGTGNDFIMLDNRDGRYDSLNPEQIRFLCDRHMGIGADGLIALQADQENDFAMFYANSDGNESSMCGNGGRCLVAFAHHLKVCNEQTHFKAIDGLHQARITDRNTVELQMQDVSHIIVREHSFELNTGSPHYVCFTEDINQLSVKQEGALIRYSPLYKESGINVNFVERIGNRGLFVRTYERGVEDETLSCGTGVTASAIASVYPVMGNYVIPVKTPGGNLEVRFKIQEDGRVEDIWLCGPATRVFEGELYLV